jgi:AcrR family transcriptional regulator
MTRSNTYTGEAENTREEILEATHEVLCERGYGGTSMSRIADRVGISKSVLYHHYDDKDELFWELLDVTLAMLIDESFHGAGADPVGDLRRFLDLAFAETLSADIDDGDTGIGSEFTETYIELRAQAAHDERYRVNFTENEERLRRRLAAVLAAAGERGEIREVDPEDASEYLLTLVQGVIFRRVTTSDVDVDRIRREVERYLDLDLTPPVR